MREVNRREGTFANPIQQDEPTNAGVYRCLQETVGIQRQIGEFRQQAVANDLRRGRLLRVIGDQKQSDVEVRRAVRENTTTHLHPELRWEPH